MSLEEGSTITRFFGFTDRARRPRIWIASLVLMLSWFVLWIVVAKTVYRFDSMRIVLAGAAVSFVVVAAAAGAIAIKRLHDRDMAAGR